MRLQGARPGQPQHSHGAMRTYDQHVQRKGLMQNLHIVFPVKNAPLQ